MCVVVGVGCLLCVCKERSVGVRALELSVRVCVSALELSKCVCVGVGCILCVCKERSVGVRALEVSVCVCVRSVCVCDCPLPPCKNNFINLFKAILFKVHNFRFFNQY